MTDLKNVKTRFCPSPTGELHLGGVRTALFNWLFAKKHNGTFLLRMEDTDRERSKVEFAEKLQEDMLWLGMDWQEGVAVGGENGPYNQSERQSVYDQFYDGLIEKGTAYPCFCTEAQLKIARKAQLAAGKPPRYPGTCRSLTKEEVGQRLGNGEKPVLRFRVPQNEIVQFHDLVHGRQRFQTNDIGDFVIRRGDGTAPFMFCNAIDDSLMGVTHAFRGADHITNTPRQIMILEALGLRAPEYGHIALILGSDGGPLSKRLGSLGVATLREQGCMQPAIINYLARLGHYYGHDEFLSNDELAAQFNIENLNKAPARFDEKQMKFWQHQTVQHIAEDKLWPWMEPAVKGVVPESDREKFVDAIKANIEFPIDAKKMADMIYHDLPLLDDDLQSVLNEAGPEFFTAAMAAVNSHGLDYKSIVNEVKEKCGVKGKGLFMPLRVALTGMKHGPELAKILPLIGVEGVKKRLNRHP